jgi:hypothetical protein
MRVSDLPCVNRAFTVFRLANPPDFEEAAREHKIDIDKVDELLDLVSRSKPKSKHSVSKSIKVPFAVKVAAGPPYGGNSRFRTGRGRFATPLSNMKLRKMK